MRTLSFIMLVLTALLLTACTQAAGELPAQGTLVTTEKGQYRDISVDQLKEMLDKKDFVFVNVHIPFEGNIPNTDLSIPYNKVEQNLGKLPQDKNAKIVLYCRSDHMSNIAAKTLADLGYTNLYNLVGGFNAWEISGLPIENDQ